MSFVADLRAVVAGRDFRRLYATRLISQASDGVLQVGLASYVFFSPERQTTAAKAAAAFAVLLLPYSIIGPFAGILLDRWRRRQVLVYAGVVRAALVVALATSVANGLEGPLFYGTALVVLSVNRFFLAALSAALPHVVVRAELVMANSLSTTSGTIAAFLGGGLGYALRYPLGVGRSGTTLVLVATAGAYLCSSLPALTLDRDLLGPDRGPRRQRAREALGQVARDLRDGARHVWERQRAGRALAAIIAQRFFYGVWTLATALLYRNYFHAVGDLEAGVRGLALVLLASGAGFFAAALVTPSVTARIRKEAWIALLLALASVAQLALGIPYAEAPYVAAAFVFGAVSQGAKICVDTLVQESIDDGYRGRVFSFYDMAFNVSFVSAAVFAAFTLPETGKSYAVLGVVSAGYALTGLAYWLAARGDVGRAADARLARLRASAGVRRDRPVTSGDDVEGIRDDLNERLERG